MKVILALAIFVPEAGSFSQVYLFPVLLASWNIFPDNYIIRVTQLLCFSFKLITDIS